MPNFGSHHPSVTSLLLNFFVMCLPMCYCFMVGLVNNACYASCNCRLPMATWRQRLCVSTGVVISQILSSCLRTSTKVSAKTLRLEPTACPSMPRSSVALRCLIRKCHLHSADWILFFNRLIKRNERTAMRNHACRHAKCLRKQKIFIYQQWESHLNL